MKDISKTTIAGVLMLLIVAVCLAMFFQGKMTPQETVINIGLLSAATISAVGHIAAKDASAPVAVQTTEITPAHGDTPAQITTSVTPPEGEK